MTSVERVLEYSRLEEEEDEEETPSKVLVPEMWPEKGEIVFRNVSVRYSPQAEPVLKELTFEIKAKVGGIVGDFKIIKFRCCGKQISSESLKG